MTAGHVELVRRFYDALNANDLAGLGTLGDDAIEYVNPDVAAEPGTRIGPDAFRTAFEGLHASFDDFRCEPEEITAFPDLVVVVARSTGAGRMSDIPFEEVHGHLLALSQGRIVSFRWFQTVEQAYAAAHERSFRRGMEAYSRGDYETALEGFHPEIEWSAETDLVPDAAVYRGHEGVRRFWAEWSEVIEGMSLEVEECRALEDDWVLAVTRASGTGAGSGAAVASGRFAQLAQFREGLVVRVRLFGDVKRALAAAAEAD
jgi:ketosteroid isomerase-like protein